MISRLQDKRIFITEDNPMNRTVYTLILRREGATFEFDRWGHETLTRLKGFQPDLIILDLMLLRNADGFTIFTEIRKDPQYNHTPIVAISASDPSIALPKCREMGFSGFIIKPIAEHLLVKQLRTLIDGEQVWYVGERYSGEFQEIGNKSET
jgi:two-component system, sensor histidine kinase and response regulator